VILEIVAGVLAAALLLGCIFGGPILLRRNHETMLRPLGLQGVTVVPGSGALSALRISGPPYRLSPTRLSRGLMLSSAGVTSRIDRLERRGFVRRLADPDDRRGVIIELTDEGREVVDEAVAAIAISDRQLLDRLDPQDVEQLEGLLRKLLALLEPSE